MPARDDTVFLATRLALAAAQDAVTQADVPTAGEEMLLDAFVSLFDRSPQLRREVPEHLTLRREMFRLACSTQLYSDLNARTAHRYDLSSSLAPLWAGEVLRCEQQARLAVEEALRRRRELEDLQNSGAPDEATAEARSRVDQAERKLRQTLATARRAMMARLAAMRDAAHLAEELSRMGWGSEAGVFARLAADGKVQAATVQAVKQVAAWFGRLRELWGVAKTRTPRRGPRISGITRGDDLLRMLPQEHLRMTTPGLAILWAIDLSRRRILQYRRTGAEHRAGRGPVIVLTDESGSMAGEPVAYAKAFAFLLRLEAKAGGRKCHIVSFSHRPEDMRELPDGATVQEAAEWAGRFAGGGTDWVPPLNLAVRLTAHPEYRHADIVMLTDGACKIPEHDAASIASRMSAAGARLFVFLFGHGNPEPLRPVASRIYRTALDDNGILRVLSEFHSHLEEAR